MNIALLLLGVRDQYCGGAERFFCDFFEIYKEQKVAKHNLFLFTDSESYKVLKNIGKIKSNVNIVCLKEWNNRFKNILEEFQIKRKLISKKIDIVHVTSYTVGYLNRLRVADKRARVNKLKIILNIVDPELPYTLGNNRSPKFKSDYVKYQPLFNEIQLAGVYTWYKLFKQFSEDQGLFKSKPYIEAVETRFTGMSNRLKPFDIKKKEIVWAARLVQNKQPLFFIEALKLLKDGIEPELFNGWRIRMFGAGPLLEEVKTNIQKFGLGERISLEVSTDLANVFNSSTCFVSTQDYENFPSQSMNEAMAAGNVIISRNVGQTNYFVKHGVNGFLAEEDTPAGLANAMKQFMENENKHATMISESVKLTKEVHTPENFIRDIDLFWDRFKV